MVMVMVVVVVLMLPAPVLLLVLIVLVVVVVLLLLLLQLLLHCTPPQVWCQYGQNMWRTCVSPSAPPSQVPCPPFCTFTRHLHHPSQRRLPVRGQAD